MTNNPAGGSQPGAATAKRWHIVTGCGDWPSSRMLSGPPLIDFTDRVLVSPFQTTAEREVPTEANFVHLHTKGPKGTGIPWQTHLALDRAVNNTLT
uniref:hypothetical protein n=1 Tax=Arthrobacter sp. 68b TaxID=311808 RepID=UPI0015657B5B|nr:hypothetical protein [Arthrobacter sp. 68b]